MRPGLSGIAPGGRTGVPGAGPGLRAAKSIKLQTMTKKSNQAAAGTAGSESGDQPASYEEALAELERVVAAMEGGQLPLDQLLGSYQRSADLLAYCRSRLEAVEQQVQVLEEGRLKPWEGAA